MHMNVEPKAPSQALDSSASDSDSTDADRLRALLVRAGLGQRAASPALSRSQWRLTAYACKTRSTARSYGWIGQNRSSRKSVMPISAEQRENSLLAALPDPEWQRWEPLLEPVDMPLGEVLYESGTTQTHVYFPTTGIVSLLYVMEN
jgi:hypothetical protein